MKLYGVQKVDGAWLRWFTTDSGRNEGAPDTGWGPFHMAWKGTEREAKAMSQLITGGHPLRVRVPSEKR